MKVLLFTHKSDIDGMGNVVLAKLSFSEVDYVLCETFNLQNEVSKYYDNGSIYNYDKIFITDLWLEEPTLSKIANDKQLKDKFFVFDHHESEGDFNKYPFTTIRISDDQGLCSGTSLFYEYFKQHNFDMDFAMLISLDNGTISYRTVKDGVNVRLIAEAMGGKGHDKTASSPISEEQKKELIKVLTMQE